MQTDRHEQNAHLVNNTLACKVRQPIVWATMAHKPHITRSVAKPCRTRCGHNLATPTPNPAFSTTSPHTAAPRPPFAQNHDNAKPPTHATQRTHARTSPLLAKVQHNNSTKQRASYGQATTTTIPTTILQAGNKTHTLSTTLWRAARARNI